MNFFKSDDEKAQRRLRHSSLFNEAVGVYTGDIAQTKSDMSKAK